jgi:hypothetical protein
MDPAVTARTIVRSLAAARPADIPFRHWRPRAMLDGTTAVALATLPLTLPADLDWTTGRREANNKTRLFFDPAGQAAIPAMRAVAEAMQSADVVAACEKLSGIGLAGTFLRIEYCRDGDGFWLEPHTDIGAKRITILTYLSTGGEAEGWGTDVYDGSKTRVESIPGDFNCALLFVPGPDTWHGFDRRPVRGLRRSLMINYVGAEWRARHELTRLSRFACG